MILYGCPATGTVSLSVPSLVCLPYQPQVHDNQINRKLTTTFSQSELNKPFGSTLLVNSCRKGGAKEKPAANSIRRKVSISTVALTGVRPPSSACGNNKAVERIISKCPRWVATMHREFWISKVQQLIFIRHEHKKYSVYILEISNNNNTLRLTTLAKLT